MAEDRYEGVMFLIGEPGTHIFTALYKTSHDIDVDAWGLGPSYTIQRQEGAVYGLLGRFAKETILEYKPRHCAIKIAPEFLNILPFLPPPIANALLVGVERITACLVTACQLEEISPEIYTPGEQAILYGQHVFEELRSKLNRQGDNGGDHARHNYSDE